MEALKEVSVEVTVERPAVVVVCFSLLQLVDRFESIVGGAHWIDGLLKEKKGKKVSEFLHQTNAMDLLLLLFWSIDIAGIQQLPLRGRLSVSEKISMSPIVLNVKDENRQVKAEKQSARCQVVDVHRRSVRKENYEYFISHFSEEEEKHRASERLIVRERERESVCRCVVRCRTSTYERTTIGITSSECWLSFIPLPLYEWDEAVSFGLFSATGSDSAVVGLLSDVDLLGEVIWGRACRIWGGLMWQYHCR